jgi:HEPN domain-containing protein
MALLENTKLQIITLWKSGAIEALDTAEYLCVSGRISGGLFFLHLAFEKLIKGLFVEKYSEHAPYIHDLVELAFRAKISTTEEQKELLIEISKFNIKGRYEEYKEMMYQKATKEYGETLLGKGKILFKWLKDQYQHQ